MALGHGQKEAVVALADGLLVAGGREALGGVGADRLEHHQSRRPVGVLAAHEQALGDQAVERVKTGGGDRFGGLHRRAAGEHREPGEAGLLGVAEQVVAPVDGRAQCLLARRCIAGAGAERSERLVEALGDLPNRQQSTTGGR